MTKARKKIPKKKTVNTPKANDRKKFRETATTDTQTVAPVSDSTVCLNMIVKNEELVIARCLDSIKSYIDYWVIADTGSADGTIAIIQECMEGIPGELLHHEWKNFGHNRTLAIEAAENKADYIITIDADEFVEFSTDLAWKNLSKDVYMIRKFRGDISFWVPCFVRSGLNWRWDGVLHEHLLSEQPPQEHVLHYDAWIQSPKEGGARAADSLTYKKDALILESALVEDPDNTRNVFYLAQSYRDAKDFELALRYYKQRISMGKWREEVFFSLYQIAFLHQYTDKSWGTVLDAFLTAYAHSPQRIEPLYHVGMHYSQQQNWPCAWLYLEKAARQTRDYSLVLFIEQELYEWRAKMEAAVAAFYVGEHEAAIELNEFLLSSSELPENMREQVSLNLELSVSALKT